MLASVSSTWMCPQGPVQAVLSAYDALPCTLAPHSRRAFAHTPPCLGHIRPHSSQTLRSPQPLCPAHRPLCCPCPVTMSAGSPPDKEWTPCLCERMGSLSGLALVSATMLPPRCPSQVPPALGLSPPEGTSRQSRPSPCHECGPFSGWQVAGTGRSARGTGRAGTGVAESALPAEAE